jgi:hypothetical protein
MPPMWHMHFAQCVCVRFTGKLPYPQIAMTSSSPLHLNLGTRGMIAPSKSSVVLVAGSALDDIKAVMDKVDSLGQDMLMIPYAIVLLVEDQDKNRILNTTRHSESPPVVSIIIYQFKQKICDYVCGSVHLLGAFLDLIYRRTHVY